ncbi:MAG: protein BatD [Deltaproteobacteria bacterium]|nr:protein BatD [Deltaproteobacteria bacterium]
MTISSHGFGQDKRRTGKTLVAFAILAFAYGLSGVARADEDIEIRAEVSPRTLVVGDVISVSITATAHVEGGIEIDVPEVQGLVELSRSQAESTSIAWSSQGQLITREQHLTLELSAERAGTFRFGPITAQVGRSVAQTKIFSVEVRDGSQSAPVISPDAATSVLGPSEDEGDLFVRYRVDRASGYLGQQILLDLEIYANPRLNFGVEELPPPPSIDGFWTEVIDQPQRLERRRVTVDKKRYDLFRVWRVALFPIEAGQRTIPAAQATFSQNRSIFQSGSRVRRRVPSIAVEAKNLPATGRPPEFKTTNVGTYELRSSVDQTNIPAGKGVVLRIVLAGEGNIKSARLPEVGDIDGFRVFPPAISDRAKTSMEGVSGEKTAEILLVPTRGGKLTIPAFSLPIFDPERAEYFTASTRPIVVTVEGTPNTNGSVSASADPPPPSSAEAEPASARSPSTQSPALRPLHFRSSLDVPSKPAYKDPALLGLFFASPALFLLFTGAQAIRRRLSRETPSTRRRSAIRTATHRLRQAQDVADSGRLNEAQRSFHEALIDYLQETTGTNLSGLTIERIASVLTDRNAPSELIERVRRELEAGEYARFAGGIQPLGTTERATERWSKLIHDLAAWTPEEVS